MSFLNSHRFVVPKISYNFLIIGQNFKFQLFRLFTCFVTKPHIQFLSSIIGIWARTRSFLTFRRFQYNVLIKPFLIIKACFLSLLTIFASFDTFLTSEIMTSKRRQCIVNVYDVTGSCPLRNLCSWFIASISKSFGMWEAVI